MQSGKYITIILDLYYKNNYKPFKKGKLLTIMCSLNRKDYKSNISYYRM